MLHCVVWCGKDPLERPRRKWKDNINMNIREVDFWDQRWMELIKDSAQWQILVLAVLNLWVALPLADMAYFQLLTVEACVHFQGS
jgi:hypothetical protein